MGRLGFQPNNFLSAKTVQFCAWLMQKCAKKCKKSYFWSSLKLQTTDYLKSACAGLLRAFALAMTKDTSEQNGQKNTQ